MKPIRILLCPDKPDWAFDNIANNIIRFAPEHFHIQKFYIGREVDEDIANLFALVAAQNIDVVHFFWREAAFKIFQPLAILNAAKKLQMEFNDLIDIIGNRVFTTSVYDHLFSSGEEFEHRANSFFMVDAYSVSSRKLFDIYSSARSIPKPDAVITDGVDLEFFTPSTSLGKNHKELTIGWVGNSDWGKKLGTDPKGYHNLFKPAMDILQQQDPRFRAQIADRQLVHIPFSDMPNYYRSIDLLACTSSIEGTPNPVLEAMACGVPIVATDVGVVPELFGPLQSRHIIQDPSPEKFSSMISKILKDKEHCHALSQENLSQIKDWSWQNRVRPWWGFWRDAIQQAQNPRFTKRRENALSQRCITQILSERHSDYSVGLISILSNLKSRLLNR
ncbi:MAG: glycosyltransferase [Hyphomicrobiales bacterium]